MSNRRMSAVLSIEPKSGKSSGNSRAQVLKNKLTAVQAEEKALEKELASQGEKLISLRNKWQKTVAKAAELRVKIAAAGG